MLERNNINVFFIVLSQIIVFCGICALILSEPFTDTTIITFAALIILNWLLQAYKKQYTYKTGTFLIILAIPFLFIFWNYPEFVFSSKNNTAFGFSGILILVFSVIKLLQIKTDRDWLFLYFVTFLDFLIAANLNPTRFYFILLLIFSVCIFCNTIVIEIKKSSQISKNTTFSNFLEKSQKPVSFFRFIKITGWLSFLIILLIAPIFFLLPRIVGAGFKARTKNFSKHTGFSDSVKLGAPGLIEQSDEIEMRVRLNEKTAKIEGKYRWRGVALDFFDNKMWSNSQKNVFESLHRNENNTFIVDSQTKNKSGFVAQTVFLEPSDSPVIFALANPIAVQSNFQTLSKDSEDTLTAPGNEFQRATYRVYSVQTAQNDFALRADDKNYTSKDRRYLELPVNLDKRVGRLGAQLTDDAGNRFDKAKAVEKYLQNNFGYTLDLKVSGEQPVADFLFNIREGHCEYFATAMAVILRTQGIATRIVNGFQEGDYNETADVYIVRKKNAHSWVEVYFPGEDVWIPFDPTPVAYQNNQTASLGFIDGLKDYSDALETFWIQYFVSYDNQEQYSLVHSVKGSLVQLESSFTSYADELRTKLLSWWKNFRGDYGFVNSLSASVYGIVYVVFGLFCVFATIKLYKKFIKPLNWKLLFARAKNKKEANIIQFYEKMQIVLKEKGLTRQIHQTPLEFAFALKMPEAVYVTEKYNRVRFGEKELSAIEAEQIENWLKQLKRNYTI